MNNFACNVRCQTKQIDIALQSTREHMRPQCISVIRNEHALCMAPAATGRIQVPVLLQMRQKGHLRRSLATREDVPSTAIQIRRPAVHTSEVILAAFSGRGLVHMQIFVRASAPGVSVEHMRLPKKPSVITAT